MDVWSSDVHHNMNEIYYAKEMKSAMNQAIY